MIIKLKPKKKYKNINNQKIRKKEDIFKYQIKNLEKLEHEGFVYVIGSHKYKFFKVGFSQDPFKRLKSIQTGCPFQVWVVLIINATMDYEKQLHRKFRRENTVGEWFRYRPNGKFANWLDAKLRALNIQMGYSVQNKTKDYEIKEQDLDNQFKRQFSKWG